MLISDERLPDSIAEARDQFPAAAIGPYFDVSLRGLLPTRTRDLIHRFVDARTIGRLEKTEMFEAVENARARFASLIRAEPDEIALTKNVSEGVNLLAGSLPWQSGDSVVLCSALEHPNNVFPWLNLGRRLGVRVIDVPPENGRIPSSRMGEAIEPSTRLVTVPTATFSPGFVTDLAPLADACAAGGTLLFVDAAQTVGILHTDVGRLGIDALACATQKGLLALYGQGFLYCRRAVAESLVPVALARYGVRRTEGENETVLEGSDFEYATAARRFELGNYNYLGAAAAVASLELIEALGTPQIEAHVRRVSRRLALGFLERGLPLVGAPPGSDLGHIVAVGESGAGRHDSADDPAMNELYEALRAGGVTLSVRRGVLRFSCHLYNDDADVDRVLSITDGWLRRGASYPGT